MARSASRHVTVATTALLIAVAACGSDGPPRRNGSQGTAADTLAYWQDCRVYDP